MNVAELKDILENFDDDTEVMLAYPSGDYWGSIVAYSPGYEDIQLEEVEYSQYHKKFKVIDDTADKEGEAKQVLIIQ